MEFFGQTAPFYLVVCQGFVVFWYNEFAARVSIFFSILLLIIAGKMAKKSGVSSIYLDLFY
jgi:hypothetical protein